MQGMVNTFKVEIPFRGETLNILFFLFRGNADGSNGRKPFTYSIVCRITGMKITLVDALINTWYGKGKPLTDIPVIQNNQFYFSNHGQKAATLQINMNIEAADIDGNIVSVKHLVELRYSPFQFFVCGLQSQHGIKQAPLFTGFKEKQSTHLLQTGLS